MAEDFVWAINSKGKICKCKAKPENRGKRNCNHRFHQEPGQTLEEFQEMYLSQHQAEGPSIFSEEEIDVIPYRMTEEEKALLPRIETKKDLQSDVWVNGAVMELDTPVWNDMDKNTLVSLSKLSRKDIEGVIDEETYIYMEDDGRHKAGDVYKGDITDEALQELPIGTGIDTLNYVSEEKFGYRATTDIYVIPLYMRPSSPGPDGTEVDSDLTEAYKHIFATKKYGSKNLQKKYEHLISTPTNKNNSVYATKTLSDMLPGKKGVFRGDITGRTIPYTGRGVAIPDVDINYDEASIPPSVAVDIFKPTITNNLKEKGFSDAQIAEVMRDARNRHQENVSPLSQHLIQSALEEGNVRVILNRQPSLHSASMQGFIPKIKPKNTVGVNPIVAKGYGLDHDGDTMAIIGINSSEIAEKVDKELHPSNFKYTPRKQDDIMMKPTKDALFGIMNILNKRS